jgi:hypothetical protein
MIYNFDVRINSLPRRAQSLGIGLGEQMGLLQSRGGMMGTEVCRLAVRQIVEAPPSAIFELVCDPKRQVEIDGSGMLQAAPDSRPVTSVGDTFEMEMDREPLGDLPMGRYKAFNTVTKFVPDALLEWSVGSRERRSYGHVFGWEIRPVDDAHTEITNYCDWTDAPEEVRDKFPLIPERMLEKSVGNLAALAVRGGESAPTGVA